jgi:sugar phosphate isomerase/epimerase
VLGGASAISSRLAAATIGSSARIPMGFNSYCLRALRWTDFQLLDYAAGLKLDAMFLQDSLDPDRDKPEHWRKVKEHAAERGLHLETGVGAILPKSPDAMEASRQSLLHGAGMAAAMGSPVVRCLHATDREHFPPGPAAQHIQTSIRLFKSVRQQAIDAGVKFAIENHKDFQAWEMREVIEGAGKDFVGSYLDTGNPVFVCEDPMTTLETLGPYALTVHLRDSAIYETPRGAAVEWVPLGEGAVDFRKFIARLREIANPVYVYIKPITGRPPQVLPYLEASFWETFPKARASEFARFLALAKSGRPYAGHVVIEDLPGRQPPEAFVAAIQYQQREHMERSVEYGKKVLDLGIRWRS